ncbi:hypothetical protein ACWC5I_05360 [Kitasatospora sp. NPDC001574]
MPASDAPAAVRAACSLAASKPYSVPLKYKRLRSYKRFRAWWSGLLDRAPGLFKHWAWMREFEWTR